MRRHLVPTLILFALAACGDDPCPAGTTPIGDTCVPADGGADSSTDSSTDADTGTDADAGPCGMACTGGTPYCDEGAGTCVACLMDSHCTALDAPECDAMGACVACTGNEACTGRTDAEVCAPDGDNAGSCVECTATEATACADSLCTTGNACSAYGTTQDTCEACDTDANCGEADHYCVPLEYPVGTARGGYCLKDNTSGCARPYSVDLAGRTSLSGAVGQTYCGINEMLATCEAVRALVEDQMCSMGMDTECPESGLCRRVGSLLNRCTYRCAGADSECIAPPTAGSTCDDGGLGEDNFCGG